MQHTLDIMLHLNISIMWSFQKYLGLLQKGIKMIARIKELAKEIDKTDDIDEIGELICEMEAIIYDIESDEEYEIVRPTLQLVASN